MPGEHAGGIYSARSPKVATCLNQQFQSRVLEGRKLGPYESRQIDIHAVIEIKRWSSGKIPFLLTSLPHVIL